jgi:hypothetical protein
MQGLSGTEAAIWVPCIGRDRISNIPPTMRERSCILRIPRPTLPDVFARFNPAPVSERETGGLPRRFLPVALGLGRRRCAFSHCGGLPEQCGEAQRHVGGDRPRDILVRKVDLDALLFAKLCTEGAYPEN